MPEPSVPEPSELSWLSTVRTPAYAYDLVEVRRSHRLLHDALPEPSEVYYSVKANPHPAVLATLRALGCRAEVCSPGELEVALDAGFRPDQLLYTGPGKRDVDMAGAVKAGVGEFSVDSPHGLAQLDAVLAEWGATASCLLRVNDDRPAAGQGLAMTGVASQFGADASWITAEPERFRGTDRARLDGLHLYMGTNLVDVDALAAQFAHAAATAARLAEALGTRPAVLDLGGGFGAPFARAGALPDLGGLAERLAALLDVDFPGWRAGQPRVAFESGRFLTSTCGRLYARVLDVKRSHGRDVLVLESGINHLGGMSGLRRLPPIAPHLAAPEHVLSAAEPVELADALVTGPLCTPLDTWARGATVPSVHPGDLVCVPNVGAYGLSASLVGFLSHPLPAEVVLDGDRPVDVTRLQLRRHRVDEE